MKKGVREEPSASLIQGAVLTSEQRKRGMIRTSITVTIKHRMFTFDLQGAALIDLHVQLI